MASADASTPVHPVAGSATGRRTGRPWIIAATLLAIAAGIFLALAPLSHEAGQSGSPATSGQVTEPGAVNPDVGARPVRRSLVESEGTWVLGMLAVPILISALPLLGGRRTRPVLTFLATLLLGICVMLAWPTLGAFYLPSTVAMLVATVKTFPAFAP